MDDISQSCIGHCQEFKVEDVQPAAVRKSPACVVLQCRLLRSGHWSRMVHLVCSSPLFCAVPVCASVRKYLTNLNKVIQWSQS